MADLVVPQLGESITEAVVARWLKNVGDAVVGDEPVVDLETDKITVQLPSPVAGALAEQKYAVGATVKVGDVIGSVTAGEKGKAAAKPAAAPAPAPVAKPAATPAPAPAAKPAATPAVAAAPRAANGNGRALEKDAILRLTPSQRVTARETGSLPSASALASPAARPSTTASRTSIRATRSCRCPRCASASPSGSSRRSTRPRRSRPSTRST